MKTLCILLAIAGSVPALLWDIGLVMTEGPGVNPETPARLVLPRLWFWALDK